MSENVKGVAPSLNQAMFRLGSRLPDLSKQASATMFLIRSWLFERLTISTLPSEMNAFGGSNVELQLTSKEGPIEQPDLRPTPNGYGTVKFPHLVSQFGLAMVFGAAEERGRRKMRREKKAELRGMIVGMSME